MLDIKFIRENVDLVKESICNKNEKANVDDVIALDDERKKALFDFEELKKEQNRKSKEIAILKRNKQDASGILAEMKEVSAKVKGFSSVVSEVESKLNSTLLKLPNIPDTDVPVGKDETSNKFIREWGNTREFDFEPKDHLELATDLDILDMQRGAKVTGSGFSLLKGKGSMLERALINFMIDFHIEKHNYTEVTPPFIVNRSSLQGTGQLPKLEEDMYHVSEDDLFLIPTAEVPVTNIYSDEILANSDLPIKHVAYSACFRREAGSYGKDTKGLQRLHQFNKVEMVRFVEPEKSDQALEDMVIDAEEILQALGLKYRVVMLATGDLSFASAKTYDLEVWAEGSKKYLEVSSVSNFRDFQARRASIRFRDKEGKVKYLNTLNGSGLATPRTMIAIIENYQKKNGKIEVPLVLRKYMNGLEEI